MRVFLKTTHKVPFKPTLASPAEEASVKITVGCFPLNSIRRAFISSFQPRDPLCALGSSFPGVAVTQNRPRSRPSPSCLRTKGLHPRLAEYNGGTG